MVKAEGNNYSQRKEGFTSSANNYFNEFPEFDQKVITVLRLYRLVSLLLTSAFYLYEPIGTQQVVFKLGVVFFLLLAALMALLFYRKNSSNPKAVGMLALVETVGIAIVMAFTGGFESPFIWYALNPLIISSMHLPFVFTWVFLGLLMVLSIVEEIFLYGGGFLAQVVLQHLDVILILLLVTLIVQIFSRLYLILTEQSQRFKLQQEELFSAYQNLSENHLLIQALSNFQREVVSHKREKDVFSSLLSSCESVFPFKKTAVLYLEESVPPDSLTPGHPIEIISTHNRRGKRFFDPSALAEVRDRWQEFSPQKNIIVGENKDWIALPIWRGGERLMAVFMAWIKPGVNIKKFPGELLLFLYFTEQVIQSLLSLKQTEKTLHHLSSLYEAVETITSRSDIREVIDLFTAYTKAMTSCDKVVFWIDELDLPEGEGEQKSIYTVKGKRSILPEKAWREEILQAWSQVKESTEPLVQLIGEEGKEETGQLICVPVKSRSRCFGMLAGLQSKKTYNVEDIIQTLSFMADLSAISIERNMAELFADRLLVIEEQNRIANEIHDSVSQNLFSIVYGLEALTREESLSPQYRERLDNIRDVAAQTAKELRLLIYRLSPRHRGDDTFIKELESYLEGLGNLNQVSIDFEVSGKEEYLNPAMRKAFYRIIREATGNAVRHGEGDAIKVELDMTPFGSNLIIKDNGKGFNVDIYSDKEGSHKKLGLVNMRELALSLGGSLTIDSKEEEGTLVKCNIPTSPVSRGESQVN